MFLTEHTEFTERKQKEQSVVPRRFALGTTSFSVFSVSSSKPGERVRVIRGFTLVELLLVMGVIVILLAMMFPVIIGSKEKARKKQALTEAHNIVLALKGYRMEFDKWPNQTQATNDTTYFTNNYKVILPLIGHNARGKVFLAVQATNQTDSITNLVDPWGVPYVICINEDMSASCLIDFTNVPYANIFVSSGTNYYSATNYSVVNMEVAVASFAGKTNADPTNAVFEVETWSEPQ